MSKSVDRQLFTLDQSRQAVEQTGVFFALTNVHRFISKISVKDTPRREGLDYLD